MPKQRFSSIAPLLLASTLLLGSVHRGYAQSPVELWEEPLVIPTYEAHPPDLNPRFYSGRVYQGAKASFYPYPVIDRLSDAKKDKTYRAVYLENQYIRLSILPEIGGRIFSALDKTNNYDFFYRQHVVKPALIGMLGAWISGGVEWNIPHHHRATSFMPVDHTFEEHADGSKTVWVGEIELRHRMKWILGVTLHPDRSTIEMTVKIFNRTPLAHSFLFWINPAVHATPEYQVIFPPSTEYVVQHGKPEFASWPIARQVYGGVDYTRGVDISWWKNHPKPISFFAWNSSEDFFGGYDHGKQAGVLHVADHHVVPGKKFFEWGNGPQGEVWSRILTDADGPYLELMAGAYSDNQPDYSWCQPGEVKIFKHHWYPVRELGGAKNANLEAAVNLEVVENHAARIAFHTTAPHEKAEVRLQAHDRILLEKDISIAPDAPFVARIALPEGIKEHDLRASLSLPGEGELISYRPLKRKGSPMPSPVKRPRPPRKIETNEELYLTGLRLEQLYSPAMEPAPFYEEAIRRDPGDYRANTALGISLSKAGRYREAEARLRAAVERVSENYIRPKDGEALYYLGVALRDQEKSDEAIDAFHRAAWSHAWQAPSYHALAELLCARGDTGRALEMVDRSLAAGAWNTRALGLKATLLRMARRYSEAVQVAGQAIKIDPLDFRGLNERHLAEREGVGESKETLARLEKLMRGEAQSYLELAVDYGNCGRWREALEVLQRGVDAGKERGSVFPMLYYYLGYYSERQGLVADANRCYRLAAEMPHDHCFPLRFESVPVLEAAMSRKPEDARAPYYLGNLLFDHQPERAMREWEKSAKLDGSFYLVHRNLALAYAQVKGELPEAVASMERAVELNPGDARLFYELDLLCEAAGVSAEKRLATLTRNHEVVSQRDDAYTREILLLTRLGRHDQAISLLENRHFHNWEGRGEIHDIYVDAFLHRGHHWFRRREYKKALEDYQAALEYPENLEVGRPLREPRVSTTGYFVGKAQEALGNGDAAVDSYELAAGAKPHHGSEAHYHQALALEKLGRDEEARRTFQALVQRGQAELRSTSGIDYFAKFGERQSERSRQAQAHYRLGLGLLGQGKDAEARVEFKNVLELDRTHLGANLQLATEGTRQ